MGKLVSAVTFASCASAHADIIRRPNAGSSFFGQKPFRLILPDLLDLYKYLDAYIDRHRGVLLGGEKDPGTLFAKTVKTTGIDAAYNSTTFYEAWRTVIQRYGIYNPYTGRGAIKGLLPHDPHNLRDILETHILKQTGSYGQASYAIQDTPDVVQQHYGRFLPQDKAALAARILNQVWEAASARMRCSVWRLVTAYVRVDLVVSLLMGVELLAGYSLPFSVVANSSGRPLVVILRKVATGHEVLLLRRNRTLAGEWCQISGGIEDGEKAWEAAIREVFEETGLTCSRLYSADICEQFYEADRNAISIFPVFVGFVDPDLNVVINDEHSEFRWISMNEALDMVPFADQRHVLSHVETEFVKREPVRHLIIAEAALKSGSQLRDIRPSGDACERMLSDTNAQPPQETSF